MTGFLLTLLRLSLLGSVLGVILMGALRLLGRRISRAAGYYLWLLVLLRLALPLGVSVPLPAAEGPAGELPSEEMYLSGRALFPLTIQLSRRVAEAFGGRLPISYSGGASVHNIKGLLQAGIWPVTMATELLKPGGYQRLSQIGAWWAEEGGALPPAVDPAAVAALSDGALADQLAKFKADMAAEVMEKDKKIQTEEF